MNDISRRAFLNVSAVLGAGTVMASALIAGGYPSETRGARRKTNKTLLAIGAHFDDCPFGIPGILLKAVQQGYRVVVLNIVGDYSSWAPVKGREQELLDTSMRLAQERNIEMRFLNFASLQFESSIEAKRAVAEVVAEVKPDIAFMLWSKDRHPDHEATAMISAAALGQPGAILKRDGVPAPSRIYAYDNGPSHTIGFEPNTFVDINAVWESAQEWLGKLMAFLHNRPYNSLTADSALSAKEGLARYRGLTCGVKYSEAIWASSTYPIDIL